MSKDNQIEKLERVLHKYPTLHNKGEFEVQYGTCNRRQNMANDLYNAGFRDVGDLKKWLNKMVKKCERLSKSAMGASANCGEILNLIKELKGE